MINREGILHQQVCDYLRLQFPGAIFRTDFAAGIKMTVGQAIRHKRLQQSRAYPDLFIAEPMYSSADDEVYCGLFVELKAEGTLLYKKDGTLRSNDHFKEQESILQALRDRGYKAEFAVGFDQAKTIIDNYLPSAKGA